MPPIIHMQNKSVSKLIEASIKSQSVAKANVLSAAEPENIKVAPNTEDSTDLAAAEENDWEDDMGEEVKDDEEPRINPEPDLEKDTPDETKVCCICFHFEHLRKNI